MSQQGQKSLLEGTITGVPFQDQSPHCINMGGCAQRALEEKPKGQKTVFFDASRISHDTGILEFPTRPPTDTRERVPEISLEDFPGHLGFIKEKVRKLLEL